MTKDEIEFGKKKAVELLMIKLNQLLNCFIFLVNIDLSPVPSHILCPNCNCPANTNTVIKNTKRTHLFAILMTICG